MKSLFYTIAAVALLIGCKGKDQPVVVPDPPTISATDLSLFYGDSATTTFPVKVNLSHGSDQTVTVNFNTVDGTAIAGTDYFAKSGTLTFAPQTTQAVIQILVDRDTIKEADKMFTVVLSNPTNATISIGTANVTIRNNGTYVSGIPADGYTTPTTYAGYKPVWQDEFNGTALDTTIWGYDLGGGGWGNNELENYTNRPQNVFVSNGMLTIQAIKENYQGSAYTSGRILTKGKQAFTFGRVDIRAKLPVGQGLWPALWMLGQSIDQTGWPACGEMDIMELVRLNPAQVNGSFHWGALPASEQSVTAQYTLTSGDFSQKFHVFSLIWEMDDAEILVDNVQYSKVSHATAGNGGYPFNAPFFTIFNVAVGGTWPGTPPASTVFPQQMLVDYIRVFQKQ